MPVHDWSKVEAGIFHAFHHHWLSTISGALNQGVLPPEYYALPEQITGPGRPDVLGLERRTRRADRPRATGAGGAAVSEPTARFRETADRMPPETKHKFVRVRHVTGDRIVAVIELVSPANKRGRVAVRDFTTKVTEYLVTGVNVLVLDLHHPGRADPAGLHPVIWKAFRRKTEFVPSPERPLTLASYAADAPIRAYVEPVAVGDRLPEMPLFLAPDLHVPVPLEATYAAAWEPMPAMWRAVLES